MPSLPRGLYELLLTESLAEELKTPGLAGDVELAELLQAEAADRIALHIASVIERAVENLPEKERVTLGAAIARRLIEQVAHETDTEALRTERPVEPARLLRAIRGPRPDGSVDELEAPLIPLLDTTLLTNAPGEPR